MATTPIPPPTKKEKEYKIGIKPYINTTLKPIISTINGENIYPLYYRITAKAQSNVLKSRTNLYASIAGLETFLISCKDVIESEMNIINFAIKQAIEWAVKREEERLVVIQEKPSLIQIYPKLAKEMKFDIYEAVQTFDFYNLDFREQIVFTFKNKLRDFISNSDKPELVSFINWESKAELDSFIGNLILLRPEVQYFKDFQIEYKELIAFLADDYWDFNAFYDYRIKMFDWFYEDNFKNKLINYKNNVVTASFLPDTILKQIASIAQTLKFDPSVPQDFMFEEVY